LALLSGSTRYLSRGAFPLPLFTSGFYCYKLALYAAFTNKKPLPAMPEGVFTIFNSTVLPAIYYQALRGQALAGGIAQHYMVEAGG
jgi:hypothetical protein